MVRQIRKHSRINTASSPRPGGTVLSSHSRELICIFPAYGTMSNYSPYQLEKLVVALSHHLVCRAEERYPLVDRIRSLEIQNSASKALLDKLVHNLQHIPRQSSDVESLMAQISEMRSTLQSIASAALNLKNKVGDEGLESDFADRILLQTKDYIKDTAPRRPMKHKATAKTSLPQYTNIHTAKGWAESSSEESE